MSWIFDTGALKSQRELVQDKIIELLQPFSVASSGGFLEAIVPIGYRVDEKADDDSLAMLIEEDFRNRSPSIAIAALDSESEQAGGPGRSLASLEIEIYVFSSHKRSRTDGRARMDVTAIANQTRDPGVFAILELVWSRLFDAPLEPASAHELKRVSEHHMITGTKGTIWRQRWRLQQTYDADMARGITQLFTEAVTKLHLAPDDLAPAQITETTTIG